MVPIEMDEGSSSLRKSQRRSGNYEQLVLQAVDEALSSLGDSPKQAIYFHLEEAFKISKHDIPYKIEEFVDALEKTFGFGAKLLEIQILKHLHEKVGQVFKYSPEKGDLVLTEYVATLRRTLG